jgi:hypothetical protein
MFARITFCALILWVGCAAGLWWLRFPEAEKTSIPSKRVLESQPGRQVRRGVQKDIWTISGDQRLHFRLRSQDSVLAIEQHKGKLEAVETLGVLECCLQEAVDQKTNTQQVRYLTAPKGTYSFPAHKFVADEVLLSFYQLPGLCLPLGKPAIEPFVSGVAEEVVFSEVNHAPQLNASHLKANVKADNL